VRARVATARDGRTSAGRTTGSEAPRDPVALDSAGQTRHKIGRMATTYRTTTTRSAGRTKPVARKTPPRTAPKSGTKESGTKESRTRESRAKETATRESRARESNTRERKGRESETRERRSRESKPRVSEPRVSEPRVSRARETTPREAAEPAGAAKAAVVKGAAVRARKGVPPAEAVPPAAPARRAVFVDVENTSSEHELGRVLDDLEIERLGGATEMTAIGNWRVVGQSLARALAQRGAQLVHSAPAARVPDWSDLWIAVHAGIWLGRSRPGDTIEIVSHDRAFDAVGDAAARLGVVFRRHTYRSHAAAAETHAAGEAPAARGRRRRRRGRGRAATGAVEAPARPTPGASARPTLGASARTTLGEAPAARAPEPPIAHVGHGEEPHSASQDQIRVAIAQLTAHEPELGVNLDRLTVALKAAGFQRPPGSPRLMTRLRRMKDIEVLPNGRVRLVGEIAEIAHAAAATGEEPVPVAAVPEVTAAAGDGEEEAAAGAEDGTEGSGESTAASPARRRPRRRGGRRRGGRGRQAEAPAEPG